MSDKTDDHGRSNAIAWFQSIVEMIDAMRAAEAATETYTKFGDADAIDEARNRIAESALSVDIRGDWHAFGDSNDGKTPVEYRILLTTGGPALRLCGELDEYGEPETARLEYQDWGTPWTEIEATALKINGGVYDHIAHREKVTAYLLDFARQFYFGN